MYAFAQRSDTAVLDEPLYAHYLRLTGLARPYREQVTGPRRLPDTRGAQQHSHGRGRGTAAVADRLAELACSGGGERRWQGQPASALLQAGDRGATAGLELPRT
jgi:hypothetical protein